MSDTVEPRTRAPNFTKGQQILLFSTMELYLGIIECKNKDSIKQIDKQKAWSNVIDMYNANTKPYQLLSGVVVTKKFLCSTQKQILYCPS